MLKLYRLTLEQSYQISLWCTDVQTATPIIMSAFLHNDVGLILTGTQTRFVRR